MKHPSVITGRNNPRRCWNQGKLSSIGSCYVFRKRLFSPFWVLNFEISKIWPFWVQNFAKIIQPDRIATELDMASSLNLAPLGVILYALFDRIIDFSSLPSWTELDFLGLGAKYVFPIPKSQIFRKWHVSAQISQRYVDKGCLRLLFSTVAIP